MAKPLMTSRHTDRTKANRQTAATMPAGSPRSPKVLGDGAVRRLV